MLNIDNLIVQFDKGLRTLFCEARSIRPFPDSGLPDVTLNESEKKLSAALMRINHSGEICAQALYQGQAWTARDSGLQKKLRQAADEETEHLAWTSRRVHELGSHLSLLNPLWYTNSLLIGAFSGLLGDKWNLGFMAETERQVGIHLQGHLKKLPEKDNKSQEIIHQMISDEAKHGDIAKELGGAELPLPVRLAMQISAKVMTRTAYWV